MTNHSKWAGPGVEIQGKKDEAKYVDFHFDPRTNLDSKNELIIQ